MENDDREVSNDSMSVLASATGGKFFHNGNDLGAGLVEIAAMPDVSYSLAFSPDDLKENGVYHSLRVKIPGHPDITISARPGYFARSNEKNSPGAKFQKLNKEVMTSDNLNEIPAEVTTQSSVLATGESALKVAVHVNARNLAFKKENDARAERVIFITARSRSAGTFSGWQRRCDGIEFAGRNFRANIEGWHRGARHFAGSAGNISLARSGAGCGRRKVGRVEQDG